MRMWKLIGRRFLYLIPQLLIVSVIVFFLIRLLPGDPSFMLAGPYATTERIAEVRRQLGLDKPLYIQYYRYIWNVLQGDFGTSWRTSQPVLNDIAQRLPATIELVLGATFFSVLFGIPLGVLTAVRKRGLADRVVFVYGMLAGAIPDFWFALIAVFLFFYQLGWFPGPTGQLNIGIMEPQRITGMYVVDSLITGNWEAFRSSVEHIILPLLTLVIVYMPLILKTARSTMEEMLEASFVEYARACGLSRWMQLRYALRNALPPVITLVGIMVWFLLGGAVLVETVFAWGGLGQYAVESVVNSDYAPLQAVVLIAAVFTMLVFLLVDILYIWLDPRIKT